MTSLESSDLQRIFKKIMIFLTFYLFPDLSCEKTEFSHQKLNFWTFDTFKTKVFDFQTLISRNHASRVLHSRFPPFGFVLKPVWSIHMVLGELWRSPLVKSRFCETMQILFSIIDFPPSGSYWSPFGRFICFQDNHYGFVWEIIQKLDFTKPCLSCSPKPSFPPPSGSY